MDSAARAQLDAAKRDLLVRVADAIADDARRFVPVDTGHLRSTIEVEPPNGETIRVVAGADYAAYVEQGTRHMSAQPYLAPALYRTRVI